MMLSAVDAAVPFRRTSTSASLRSVSRSAAVTPANSNNNNTSNKNAAANLCGSLYRDAIEGAEGGGIEEDRAFPLGILASSQSQNGALPFIIGGGISGGGKAAEDALPQQLRSGFSTPHATSANALKYLYAASVAANNNSKGGGIEGPTVAEADVSTAMTIHSASASSVGAPPFVSGARSGGGRGGVDTDRDSAWLGQHEAHDLRRLASAPTAPASASCAEAIRRENTGAFAQSANANNRPPSLSAAITSLHNNQQQQQQQTSGQESAIKGNSNSGRYPKPPSPLADASAAVGPPTPSAVVRASSSHALAPSGTVPAVIAQQQQQPNPPPPLQQQQPLALIPSNAAAAAATKGNDAPPRKVHFVHDEFPELEEESVEDRYSVLLQTLLIVCVIIALKLLLRNYVPWQGEAELSEISLVFTGLFFILGQMFTIVNADLKEAEKMPMEIVSSLDQLEDAFLLVSGKVQDKVDMLEVQLLLVEFAHNWRDMVLKENGRTYSDCLNSLFALAVVVRDWDRLGAANTGQPPVVIDKIRRMVSRGTVIQRTDVLPAASALLNFFVLMSCVLLFVASYKTEVALAVVMACVMTVCLFMVRILDAMDDPFHLKPPTRWQKWLRGHMAAIQLFPVLEYIVRMERRMGERLDDDARREAAEAEAAAMAAEAQAEAEAREAQSLLGLPEKEREADTVWPAALAATEEAGIPHGAPQREVSWTAGAAGMCMACRFCTCRSGQQLPNSINAKRQNDPLTSPLYVNSSADFIRGGRQQPNIPFDPSLGELAASISAHRPLGAAAHTTTALTLNVTGGGGGDCTDSSTAASPHFAPIGPGSPAFGAAPAPSTASHHYTSAINTSTASAHGSGGANRPHRPSFEVAAFGIGEKGGPREDGGNAPLTTTAVESFAGAAPFFPPQQPSRGLSLRSLAANSTTANQTTARKPYASSFEVDAWDETFRDAQSGHASHRPSHSAKGGGAAEGSGKRLRSGPVSEALLRRGSSVRARAAQSLQLRSASLASASGNNGGPPSPSSPLFRPSGGATALVAESVSVLSVSALVLPPKRSATSDREKEKGSATQEADKPPQTTAEAPPAAATAPPPKPPASAPATRPWADKFRPFVHIEEEGAGDVSFGATYSILLQTLLIVCGIIGLKLLLREFAGWTGEADLSEISVVFTGLFFIMGQMFSNVNSELKEAEKMPMDVVASLDQLQDHFVMGASKIADKIDVADVQRLLLEFARTWRDMLMSEGGEAEDDDGSDEDGRSSSGSRGRTEVATDRRSDCEEMGLVAAEDSPANAGGGRTAASSPSERATFDASEVGSATFGDCLNRLADLMDLMRDWEDKGGVNLTYVPLAVDKIRRAIGRGTVIKRTDVLPAAGALLNFFVLMSCVLLFLASYKTEVALAVVMACVMTVCLFMARIIQSMDDPFKMREPSAIQRYLFGHMSAVKMFPITEYIERMERILSATETQNEK